MYQLSRDYEELYRLLCMGKMVVGIVDYNPLDGLVPSRDVCRITRPADFSIFMRARGIEYFGLYPFMDRYGEEKPQFLAACRELRLEWIAGALPEWKDLPESSDWHWWWNGDADSPPVPVTLQRDGEGLLFASAGQHGWNRFQLVTDMGGMWALLTEPDQPPCQHDDADGFDQGGPEKFCTKCGRVAP